MNGSEYTCTKMFKSHWIITVFDYYNFVSRDFVSSLFAVFVLMTRLAVTSYKVYHLLAHGRWFSPPGSSASSTTKNWSPWYTKCSWSIAESGIKHQESNQIFILMTCSCDNRTCVIFWFIIIYKLWQSFFN